MVHFLIDRLFGLASGSGLSKMLFSDPARCFWIWDAADEPPFGRRGEVAQIVAIFLFAALWLTLTVAAATMLWQGEAGLPLGWLG